MLVDSMFRIWIQDPNQFIRLRDNFPIFNPNIAKEIDDKIANNDPLGISRFGELVCLKNSTVITLNTAEIKPLRVGLLFRGKDSVVEFSNYSEACSKFSLEMDKRRRVSRKYYKVAD
jgi:hypothetical protein